MTKTPSSDDQKLLETILSFKYDPSQFALFAFPWGQRGTPLHKYKGPRKWQMEEFKRIASQIRTNLNMAAIGLQPSPIYLAISSGRGPGKSAFLSMLSCWFMSCWLGGTNIVTANTETQLRSRTMAELGKWHTMMINSHWFDKTTTSMKPSKWFGELLTSQLKMDTQYYYTDAQSWSEENPDAFAGAHSQIGMMVQFDEASGISDKIWTVTEGFFTDQAELRLWVVISNPRRNTGNFFECFHKNKHMWLTRYIDSRTVEGLDTGVYDRIVEQYGEDSDEARVEVKGEFPRTGSNQFIGRELVQDAVIRPLVSDPSAPLVMGVDVARFGDDYSVVRFRRGRDARSFSPFRFKGLNTMELSIEISKIIDRFSPDAVFVDGGGVGGGVVDRLRELRYRIIEVQSGAGADDSDRFLNKRTEMWAMMRDWLHIGCISQDKGLIEDLTGPEYEHHTKNKLALEPKKKMKKRGLNSPDDADALAFTFYRKVARKELGINSQPVYIKKDFNPLERR